MSDLYETIQMMSLFLKHYTFEKTGKAHCNWQPTASEVRPRTGEGKGKG